MNKTLLIFRHEFLRTFRRTGFIVLTLSLPVAALLFIGIFHIVSGIKAPPAEVTRIGYVDDFGGLNQFTEQGNIVMISFPSEEKAKQALIDNEIKSYFIVPSDLISKGVISYYSTEKQLAPPDATTSAIQRFISSNLLNGKVPPDIIARVETSVSLINTTLTATGEVAPQQGGYENIIIPGIFGLLLGLSLVFSSTYVLQSLGEEKESRLMEILLSSVSTRQLLTGKVLGQGAAGLLQVVFWIVTMPLLLNLASSSIGGIISSLHVSASFWVLGIIYFILGYLFVSTISASVAAVTSTVQEGQGLAGIYTIFNFAPFWFLSLLLIYPNSPVWVVFTIFPPSAPVLTMMRFGLTGVPVWQLAASTGVLLLAVIAGLLIAARLLRAYMLMYGKRPRLGEIVRNLRRS